MRTRSNQGKDQPLAPHFVVYDYSNPSPLFTYEQVQRIESIRKDFNEEDLTRIRKIEKWILNTNTGWLNSPAITGLRPKSTNGHRYLKRFSADRYADMIDTFLDQVHYGVPATSLPCHMPGLRVTLPNGDKFYPILFHDDLEKWARVLDEAAALFKTELGQFDHGKFVVSNGEVYPFSSICIDKLEKVPPANDW